MVGRGRMARCVPQSLSWLALPAVVECSHLFSWVVRSDGIGFCFLVPLRQRVCRFVQEFLCKFLEFLCKFRAMQRICIADFSDLDPCGMAHPRNSSVLYQVHPRCKFFCNASMLQRNLQHGCKFQGKPIGIELHT